MAYSIELKNLLAKAVDESRDRRNEVVDISHFLIAALKDKKNGSELIKLFESDKVVETAIENQDEYIESFHKKVYNCKNPTNISRLENLLIEAENLSVSDTVGFTDVIEAMFNSNDSVLTDFIRTNDLYLQENSFVNKFSTSYDPSKPDYVELKQGEFLKEFCTELVNQCETGKLKAISGRSLEMVKIEEILSKAYKNNPFLIGEPGVGKTAVVEGLAHRIFSGNTTQQLEGAKIYKLNVSLLTSTDEYKGVLAQNVAGIINEIKEQKGKAILFIDEAHTVFNKSGNGTDISNLILDSIQDNQIPIICVTNNEDYATYIGKDASLVRKFQPINIEEPSVEDTITILRDLKESLENHYGIQILDEAIVDAVKKSEKYLNHLRLPDKAIDLLDQACSSVKIKANSKPTGLDFVVREILKIEKEIKSLKQDKLDSNINKIAKLEETHKNLKKEEKVLFVEYDEKEKIKKEIQQMVNKILLLEGKSIDLLEKGENEAAAKIKNYEIPILNKQLDALKDNKFKISEKAIVNSNDVLSLVSRKTGIPLVKLEESDTNKYLNIEEDLKKRVKGQDEALKVISNSIMRSTVGLNSSTRPIGSFLFVGPTGVGKTETGKALAELLFDDEKKMIRLDMSEFQQEHMIQRLIGAPAGYVGYDAGGQLTEAVKKNPYSVILLDEVEKAHPKVWDAFLQVFDEGHLTDAKGNTVDFTNTIIIMTSNIGGKHLLKGNNDENKAKVKDEIQIRFRPEFINRIDNIVYFDTLSLISKKQIVYKFLNSYTKKMNERGYSLDFSENVVEKILSESFDENYGARPLKKYIDDVIGTFLARKMLSDPSIKKLSVDYDKVNGFELTNQIQVQTNSKTR